jgi:hypothetical protein
VAIGVGVVLVACTLFYVLLRTSILVGILLTRYLGGAIASQVRAEAGWFNMGLDPLRHSRGSDSNRDLYETALLLGLGLRPRATS